MRLQSLLYIVPIIILGMAQSLSSQTFTHIDAGFPVAHKPANAWADVDNDGDLDVFLAGLDELGIPHAGIYLNDGGSFSPASASINDVYNASCAFGDYNNDGLVDLVVGGTDGSAVTTRIYRNDGGGAFSDIGAGITGLEGGGLAWGDYNNDGWLDLLLNGRNSSGDPVSTLYNNDGGNSFSASGQSFSGLAEGSLAWADIDLDSDLDIIIVGLDASQQASSIIYLNNEGSFTQMGAGLIGLHGSSAAWGDYNNDTYPDLLLTGAASDGIPATLVYKNNNGTSFTALGGPFTGVANGSGIWGDFNNDGAMDFLVAGEQLLNGGVGGPPMPDRPAKIQLFINEGTDQFLLQNIQQNGIENNAISCGDYDNDSDLDLLVCGEMINPIGLLTINAFIFRNDGSTMNLPPSAPDGLAFELIGDEMQFSWNASIDDKTPAGGLNYNMRMGTQDMNMDVFSAHADLSDGYRRIASTGNTGSNTSWSLLDIGFGEYHVSVQAIDPSFAGSAFSSDLVIELSPTATFTMADTVCTLEETSITYTGNASPAAQYNWNFDGAVIVSGSGQGPYIVYWDTQGDKTVSLNVEENGVTSDPFSMDILVIGYPEMPGFIAGSTDICQGTISSEFVVPPITNAVTYEWFLNPPEAGSISGTSIIGTVVWDPGFYGNAYVFVRGMNYCGSSPYSDSLGVIISPLPAQAGQPVGPSALCLGNANTTYTTTAAAFGDSYQWTLIPEAAGVIFNNGLSAEIDWDGSYSGAVELFVSSSNTCGTGPASDVLMISISIPPEADAGDDQTIAYGNATQLFGSASGGSGTYNYYWMPDSLLLDPHMANPTSLALEQSAQFTFIATDNGSGCPGYDQMVVTVTGGPLMVDALADPDEVCAGEQLDLLALASGGTGNYTYSWTSNPPGFTSIEAEPIHHPEVSTMYYVEVTDGGDVVSDSVMVTVNLLPSPAGMISGPDNVCAGDEDILFSIDPVANATHYLWEMEDGIFGNSDSTSILLSIASQWIVAGGQISVSPVNACGQGEVSAKTLIVWDSPERPGMITGPDTLCTTTDTLSTYTLVTPVSGATDYIWELQPIEAGYIEGNGLTAAAHWEVSWEGEALIACKAVNECGSSEYSDPLLVHAYSCLGIEDPGAGQINLRIYPNPAREVLNVECWMLGEKEVLEVSIRDLYGRKVLEKTHPGQGILLLSVDHLSAGMYIISITGNRGVKVSRRMIVLD